MKERPEMAPVGVFTMQFGHTHMTEKHYAHLGPSYVAQTIRATFPVFDLGANATVVPRRPKVSAKAK
jgi:hypothetical protein